MAGLMANPVELGALSPSGSLASLRVEAGFASRLTDRAQTDFAEILGIANRAAASTPTDPAEQARDAAERFVASVLVQPMLALARASNDQPPPFGPGPGENQFGSILDAQRAMELVRSTRWPIVDRLTDDLTRRTDAAAETPET